MKMNMILRFILGTLVILLGFAFIYVSFALEGESRLDFGLQLLIGTVGIMLCFGGLYIMAG